VEELVATCGITRHEAELLSRLHVSKSRESAGASWNMRANAEAPAPQAAAGRKRGSLLSVVG
jgi:hypothetical protein